MLLPPTRAANNPVAVSVSSIPVLLTTSSATIFHLVLEQCCPFHPG